jgi:acyl-coenzyme A thioesterase PaaI-like protein
LEPRPIPHPAAEARPPFYTRYGITRTGVRDAPLVIEPYEAVVRHGHLRATVVAAAVDIVGSLFSREIAGTDILFTTDLSIRMPRPGPASDLRVRGRSLRSGRSGTTTAVELFTGEGTGGESLWAYGETSFARVPRAPGSNVQAVDLALPRVFASNPLLRPLEDEVGVEILAAARGEVELVLLPQVLNTEATLQGALVALLVERAGEALAEDRLGTPQRVTELDLRYLSTAKVGPVRSRAAFIGEPSDGMLRAELRDVGRDDRVTATAFLRVAPAR